MNLGQKIRSGTKWMLLGNVGARIVEFGFGVALARLLVPADFGMVATVGTLTGFAGLVLSGGMGQALIRAKEADQDDFNAVFSLQLGMGILIYVVFFVTAPWFADFFGNPLYVDLIRVTGLGFLMRPFAFMRNAWLNREMDFKKRIRGRSCRWALCWNNRNYNGMGRLWRVEPYPVRRVWRLIQKLSIGTHHPLSNPFES